MGSTFAMSAKQKYKSDALLATGLYSSDVLLTSTAVTSASCMRMLTCAEHFRQSGPMWHRVDGVLM